MVLIKRSHSRSFLSELSSLRSLLCGLTLLTSLMPKSAEAALVSGIFKYRVTNSNCPVKQKTAEGWVNFRGRLEKGTLAIGKPNQKSSGIVMFKTAQTKQLLLAAKQDCVFADSGSVKGNEGAVDLNKMTRALFSLGIMNWQEELTISSSTVTTALRSTNIASYLGVSFLKATEINEYGLNVQILYAKAEVANAATVTGTDVSYLVTNADVAGVIFSPAYYFRPSSGSVAFGASIPIFLRYAAYPTVIGSGFEVGPRFKVLSGLNIESRFERGGLFFGQKVGFLNAPKSIWWSLELGWRF